MESIEKLNKYVLAILLVFSFLVRIYAIDKVPPSLNWDEVSHGYNAYSILKTGRDEWGEHFPFLFRAYGDYKLPLYIYLSVPFIYIFGLNLFSVRLLSAVSGVGTVYFTYLLTANLFEKQERTRIISFISAFLVAFSPWTVFISRAAFEANLAVFFITAGAYFYLNGLKKENIRHFVFGIVFLGASVWAYNSARIFVPFWIFLISTLFFYRVKRLFVRFGFKFLASILLGLVFFAPMIYQIFVSHGLDRYGWVGIIDSGTIGKIIEFRKSSSLGTLLTRLVYNRPTYFIYTFGINWIRHFDPRFLFLKGGTHYQFSVPGHGILYSVDALFFVLGYYFLFRQRKEKSLAFGVIFTWSLLSPIASSATREAPHVLRFVTYLPVPMMVISFGFVNFVSKLKTDNKVWFGLYFGIIALSFLNYWISYSGNYRKNYSWAWQYGYKNVVSYIKEVYSDYDKIIFTKKYGEPHEFILFYWPWDPERFQKDENLNRFYQTHWFWVDSFDKFYFVNEWDIVNKYNDKLFKLESGDLVDCRGIKCLLVTDSANVPKNWVRVKVFFYPSGESVFEIYEN